MQLLLHHVTAVAPPLNHRCKQPAELRQHHAGVAPVLKQPLDLLPRLSGSMKTDIEFFECFHVLPQWSSSL